MLNGGQNSLPTLHDKAFIVPHGKLQTFGGYLPVSALHSDRFEYRGYPMARIAVGQRFYHCPSFYAHSLTGALSSLRYETASLTWAIWMDSEPARSAIVRASFKMR